VDKHTNWALRGQQVRSVMERAVQQLARSRQRSKAVYYNCRDGHRLDFCGKQAEQTAPTNGSANWKYIVFFEMVQGKHHPCTKDGDKTAQTTSSTL
jgi:hypothetical protein